MFQGVKFGSNLKIYYLYLFNSSGCGFMFFRIKNNNSGCPNCKGTENVIMFNWKLACEGRTNEYTKYVKSIKKVEKLKFGWLYECLNCQQKWFLSDNKQTMTRIPKEKEDIFYIWKIKKNEVNNQLLKSLIKIMANPPDLYGNVEDYIRVPCKVILKTGEEIDFSYVQFQKSPPVEPYYDNIRFIDEIESVVSSDYVLNNEIRVASVNAQEIRMGFAPTLIKTLDEKYFIVNWSSDFFEYGSFKGKDMLLAECDLNMAQLPPIVDTKRNRITYFIGDYQDSVKQLVLDNK